MASRASIGIRREQATNAIRTATEALFGEALELPTQGRDPELLHAIQLEAIAEYLGTKAGTQPVPAPEAEREETALEHMQSLEVAGESVEQPTADSEDGEQEAPRPTSKRKG